MKILIAEDDATCRQALQAMLEKWGHEVVVASDGNNAWELMQHPDAPKLMILDWMMPGMNGVDLCRKIRERYGLGRVYIIILTFRRRRDDVTLGLNAGADDYIIKPFNKDELRKRVAAGVRYIIANHTPEQKAPPVEKTAVMQRYALEMDKLAEERELRQLYTDRIAELGLLSAGIAHELNNPSTYVLGSVQNLKMYWKEIKPLLTKQIAGRRDRHKIDFIAEKIQSNLDSICMGVERILNIIDGLKAYVRMDTGQKSSCDVNKCVEQALELCHNVIKYNITVEKQLADNLPQINAEGLQIEQVLINLVTNAADAMREQKQAILTIQTYQSDNTVTIVVSDTGPGIDESELENIWQPFFTTKPVGKGTGLGLATVRKIIDSYNGKIEVRNKPQGGAEFTITLPLQQEAVAVT